MIELNLEESLLVQGFLEGIEGVASKEKVMERIKRAAENTEDFSLVDIANKTVSKLTSMDDREFAILINEIGDL